MSQPLVNSSLPGGFDLAGAENLATSAYQKALAQVGQNRNTILHQYGYSAKFDPNNGSMSNLSVDPYNTYGQLQTTLHDEATDARGAQDAETGQGIVGGLAHQAAGNVHYTYGAQKQQLGTNLMSALNSSQSDWTNATQSYNNALWTAEQQASLAAMQAQQFDTPDYSGSLDSLLDGKTVTTNDPFIKGGGATPNFTNTAGAMAAATKTIPTDQLAKIVAAATKANQSISEHGAGQVPVATKATPAKVVNNAYNTNKNKKG